MILSDFRTRVASVIGLDSNVGAERTLIHSWVNEAVIDLLTRTRCTVNFTEMATTANEWKYHLDEDIIAIKEMWRETSGTTSPLMMQVSPADIIDYRRSSAVPASTSSTYFAVEGANLLLLYPTPSEAFNLSLFYVPRPTALSGESDDPSDATFGRIPLEYHPAIEAYALMKAADYADDASSQQGDRYRRDYEQALARIKREMNTKTGVRLARARRPNDRGYLRRPHDPSTDLGY